jgi:predicted small lipoprotein YifL
MKVSKILSLVLALILVLSLAACGGTKDAGGSTPPEKTPATAENAATSVGDSKAEDVILEIENDGDATKITGAAYDKYFGGSAATGVEALLNAGKVYVNGIKVPAAENETADYQVNGVSSIYKKDSGWGFNVHKTTSADNLSFDAARLGFFETITTVRGHKTVLYGDKTTGQVNKIDTQSYDVVRITYFEDHGGIVDKIDRGDFALETNRVRPDVNNIVFHSSRFDQEIKVGDFALYYYGPSGWVMQKAVPVQGTLSKNDKGFFVINKGKSDEYVKIESNVSRYNLIICNRPTQFFTAYNRLGLTELSVITWCTPTGHPIGFTYGDKAAAKEALSLAIKNATAAKDGVAVSADGKNVAKGKKWVAQADMDTYNAALADAQTVLNSNSTPVQGYDAAIYDLAQALGEGGEKPTGFVGAQGEGTK